MSSIKEVRQAKENQKFWQILADRLGYRLYGWDYDFRATLIRDDEQGTCFEVTKRDRERILKEG